MCSLFKKHSTGKKDGVAENGEMDKLTKNVMEFYEKTAPGSDERALFERSTAHKQMCANGGVASCVAVLLWFVATAIDDGLNLRTERYFELCLSACVLLLVTGVTFWLLRLEQIRILRGMRVWEEEILKRPSRKDDDQ